MKSIIFILALVGLSSAAIIRDARSSGNELGKGGPYCRVCKLIVKEVQEIISNNKTEENIERALMEACSILYPSGGKGTEQCDDMVKAYTKELVDMIVQESDPELVCMLANLCGSYYAPPEEQAMVPPKLISIPAIGNKEIPPISFPSIGEFITMLEPEIKLNSIKTCVECKLFISYLQETFQSPKSRDTLRQWLMDNLCNTLTDKTSRESCGKMVENYSDDFFRAIAERLEPQAVCSDLKACKKRKGCLSDLPLLLDSDDSKRGADEVEELPDSGYDEDSNSKEIAELEEEQSILCDKCVAVVKDIDDYLSKHSIDDDVAQLIDQVCNKIPDDATKETCIMIVKSVGEEIVEAIHTMDNPKQFCRDVAYLC